MPLPKYQTAIEIINEVIVPQIDTNAQDIKAIAKEVVSNAKDFDKKVEEVYNVLEAKEVATEGLFYTHKAGYTKYCDDLKAEIEKLTTQITSDTSTQDIGEIVDVLSSKIEALENEENFEYDDQELKDSITKLNVDFSVFKEKVLTSKSVIDEINSKEGVIEASSIKGLIQTLNDIANKGGNSNVKVGASILEILSNGTSVMQGATRLNFIGSTVAYNNGTIDITNTGGSGASIGGAVTGGTAGSVLFINPAGILAQDNSNLFWDDTNNYLGIGTAAPGAKFDVYQTDSSSTLANAQSQVAFQFRNTNSTNNNWSLISSKSNGGTLDATIGFQHVDQTSGYADISFATRSAGGFSDKLRISSTGLVGIGTTAPTHTLTLGSTSTGIALYNTADQTTNFERVRAFWSANVFNIQASQGGTGVVRLIDVNGTRFQSSGFITNISGITAPNFFDFNYTQSFSRFFNPLSQSSGTGNNVVINPTITQTLTAGYTALLINPTETSVGSGAKLLADFQVGGVSKLNINNIGQLTIASVSASNTTPQIVLNGTNTGISVGSGDTSGLGITFAGAEYYRLRTSEFRIATGLGVVFGGVGALGDTGLYRTSAGNFAMGSGTANTTTSILSLAQVITTPATITVTANAGTVTRANRINNFTNSSAAAMTITMSTTGALDGDMVVVRIKDFSAAAQTITWVNTENSTVTAPATSNGSTTLPLTVGFQYNSATSLWRCIASA